MSPEKKDSILRGFVSLVFLVLFAGYLAAVLILGIHGKPEIAVPMVLAPIAIVGLLGVFYGGDK